MSQAESKGSLGSKSPNLHFAISGRKKETVMQEKLEAEAERDELKKRLEDLKNIHEIEDGRTLLRRSINHKNTEIITLTTKLDDLGLEAGEVASRESALMKHNKYLERNNEQLEERLITKDEFNVQYINRTMMTERLLEDYYFEKDVEQLEDQMEKENREFDRNIRILRKENAVLRNQYKSLRSRAMELMEDQKKKPNIPGPALTCETSTSAQRDAAPKEPQPSPATEECPICLVDIFAASPAVLDPCGHFFHATCVAKFNADKSCPTCCLPYTHFNVVE